MARCALVRWAGVSQGVAGMVRQVAFSWDEARHGRQDWLWSAAALLGGFWRSMVRQLRQVTARRAKGGLLGLGTAWQMRLVEVSCGEFW